MARPIRVGGKFNGGGDPRLDIIIFNAELVRIFDKLKGTQDVYVELIREQEDGDEATVAKSAVCVQGDQRPRWDERFLFSTKKGKALKFRVRISHLFRKDVLCGEAVVDLSALKEQVRQGACRLDRQQKLTLYKHGTEQTGTLYASFGRSAEGDEGGMPMPRGVLQGQLGPGRVVQGDVALQQRPPDVGLALPGTQRFRDMLVALLRRPEELEEKVRVLFKQLTGPKNMTYLRPQDMDPLAKLLGEKLRVPQDVFGEIHQMFWRFEVTGEGVLYEDEAVRLIVCMLQQYRDAIEPRPAGAVKLGDGIKLVVIQDYYEVIKELGRGGQGIAFLARNKSTRQQVVLKSYSKAGQQASVEEITKEFELLLKLKHPKISRVFDILQDLENIHIVQEPYFGGDLTTAVGKAQEAGVRVDERWLQFVMHQVCLGVQFLHNNGVVHSDLKEANVMVADATNWKQPQVIVIDFGLANKFCAKSRGGGTPGYMPPEVWDHGLWTPRGDVFSIGVMIFTMRTGRPPFLPEGHQGGLDEVKRRTKEFQPNMALGSSQLRTLTNKMLQKPLLERPTVTRVIQDPWFKAENEEQFIDTETLALLARRSEKSDIYRAIIGDMTARQNLAQLRELNDLFLRLDTNNDGLITAKELREALGRLWSSADVERLISSLGIAENSEVSYDEFVGELMAAKRPQESLLLQQIFADLDVDQTGYLTAKQVGELARGPAMERFLGGRSPEALMKLMDLDRDGQVSFEDFRQAIGGERKGPAGSMAFIVGQEVQYWSRSHGSWIDCAVTAVDADKGAVKVSCKPDTWISGEELTALLRDPAAQKRERGYRRGQEVLLWSTSFNTWIPCRVTQVDPATGAVQVDQKPHYWFQGKELLMRLKPVDRQPGGRGAVKAGVARQVLAGALLQNEGT